MTKSLRSDRRSTPVDFSLRLIELTDLEQNTYVHGPCRVEHYGHQGEEESLIVVDEPGEPPSTHSLLNIHKALIELSGRACPTQDLGDEALAMCYRPSSEAKWLVKDFVEAFGLLHWGRNAQCNCVRQKSRICDLDTPYTVRSTVRELEEVDEELLGLADDVVADQEVLTSLPGLADEGGRQALDLAADFFSRSRMQPLGLLPLFRPQSPEEKRDALLVRKARLEEKLASEIEENRKPADEVNDGIDRFFSIHWDFMHDRPGAKDANANCVSWILQEALQLRRAARLWDAIRRYRLGDSASVVRTLWTKNRDGLLWLFDAVPCTWQKPSHRHLVLLSHAHMTRLIDDHVSGGSLSTLSSFYPPGETLQHTDLRKTRVKMGISPGRPLSAAWLQFFDDVINDRVSGHICKACHSVFEPSRSDRVFCSTKCGNLFHQKTFRAKAKAGG